MREALHQLTVTLALPVAVGAVWIARGDLTEPAQHKRATAYRVELAELPLPVRERLRPPGLSTAAPAPRSAPQEETAPPERRALLPEPPLTGADAVDPASQADSARDADLGPRADSDPEEIAAPSPRAALDPLGAALWGTPSSQRMAAPVVAAAPYASSRRVTASAQVASASTIQPAPTPNARPPQRAAPASDAEPGMVPRTPRFGQRDPLLSDAPLGRRLGSNPEKPVVSPPDEGIGKPFPIASQPVPSDPGPSHGPVRPDGSPPLVPPGKIEQRSFDLPLHPASPEPALPPLLPDLPLPASQPAGNAIAMDFGPDEESLSPQAVLGWSKLRPTLLLVIPEPGSGILLGASLAALGVLRRSRRA